MRILILIPILIACDKPKHDDDEHRDPAVELLASSHSIWCEHDRDMYFCKTSACSGSDCIEVRHPHWACAQTVMKASHELQTDVCWPTLEMCETPKNDDPELEREPCRRVAKVYCQDPNGLEVCYPVPSLCARMARLMAGSDRNPADCVER